MAISPQFQFSADGVTWLPVGQKVQVAPGGTVWARLASTAGVSSVAWEVVGVDDTTPASTYASSLVVSGTAGSQVQFTAGAAQTSGILQCTVNNGVVAVSGQNLIVNYGVTRTTAKWYVGNEIGALAEVGESDPVYGWLAWLNPALRAASSAAFTAGGDLTGTNTAQTVSAIQGLPTPLGSSATFDALAIIQYEPPWSSVVDVAWDGTHLWVLGHGSGGYSYVWKVTTSGGSVTGTPVRYALPTALSASRILSDGTYCYVVGAASSSLVILSCATGAIVGLGSGAGHTGLALDGSGNLWTAGGTGIQQFIVAAVVAAYPTVTAPTATYAIAGAYDIVWDGTSLYCSTGTNATIVKVNPVGGATLATYTDGSSRTMNALLAAGGGLWATTGAYLVRVHTAGMTLWANTLATGANVATLGRMAYDGTYLYASNTTSGYVELFTASSNLFNSEIGCAPSLPSTAATGVAFDGTYVWVGESTTAPTGQQGLASFHAAGLVSFYSGPLALAYGPLPPVNVVNFALATAPTFQTGWAVWANNTGDALSFQYQDTHTYASVGLNGLTSTTFSAGTAAPAAGTTQLAFDISAGGTVDLIDIYNGSTPGAHVMSWVTGLPNYLAINYGNTNGLALYGQNTSTGVALTTDKVLLSTTSTSFYVDNHGGHFTGGYVAIATVIAAPSAPSTGFLLYDDTADGVLKAIDASSNVTSINEVMVTVNHASGTWSAKPGQVIEADSSAGTVAITVPAGLNQKVKVKWVAGANSVTITPASGTIDGAATHVLPTLYAAYEYRGNGSGVGIWS